jgi:hypothetical protein
MGTVTVTQWVQSRAGDKMPFSRMRGKNTVLPIGSFFQESENTTLWLKGRFVTS